MLLRSEELYLRCKWTDNRTALRCSGVAKEGAGPPSEILFLGPTCFAVKTSFVLDNNLFTMIIYRVFLHQKIIPRVKTRKNSCSENCL